MKRTAKVKRGKAVVTDDDDQNFLNENKGDDDEKSLPRRAKREQDY